MQLFSEFINNIHNINNNQQLPPQLYLGLSGGVDSVVLLHLCQQLLQHHPDYQKHQLIAVHFNHGLQPEADSWAEFCQRLCQSYKVPYLSYNLDLTNKIQQQLLTADASLENLARNERYKIWRQLLNADNCLLLAHHANDQAETILYRLLRGTGLTGLAGMQPVTAYYGSQIMRPLLNIPKAEIVSYAAAHSLEYVADPSNYDNKFSRNFLRNQVIPLLETRWPAVLANINRAGALAHAANSYISGMVQAQPHEFAGSRPNTLSISTLLHADPVVRQQVLRDFIARQIPAEIYHPPSYKSLQLIETEVLQARADALPSMQLKLGLSAAGSNCYITRYQDDLYVLQAKPIVKNALGGATPGIGRRAKKIFQYHKIPPWERAGYPLVITKDHVTGQERLVAIEGLWER
jgi:tRNA(Ile)-lysidine synthase